MKLFNIFVGLAVAQEGAPAEGARAMALAQRIKNAQDKCSFFMEKAMFCEPPNGKQGKYIHRLNKVKPLKPPLVSDFGLEMICHGFFMSFQDYDIQVSRNNMSAVTQHS